MNNESMGLSQQILVELEANIHQWKEHEFQGRFTFVFSLLSCGVIGQWLFFKIARSNSILIKNSRLRRQSRSLPKMQSWWGWAITSLTFEVVTWNKWHESQVCPLPWKMSLMCRAVTNKHRTEGWDCDLGFQGLKFFLAIMVWVASWDPTGRYSTLEPSVGTFRGSL